MSGEVRDESSADLVVPVRATTPNSTIHDLTAAFTATCIYGGVRSNLKVLFRTLFD